MTVIDEIKARVDIVDLVSETVKLRRSGKNYTGFCPFHDNRRTPAFAVFPDSGTWRCFGQCNEGGDIFKFVMKKEGWDFPEALEHLARRAGVQLEAPTKEKLEQDEQAARLADILEQAVHFYRHHLLQTGAGKPALEFLQRRGLTSSTIDTFELGYAPNDWEAATTFLAGKGIPLEGLLAAGLVSQRQEGGGHYDRFRNRIMFPIRDVQGRMAGFGARILDPDDVPKFLNSPQTRLFEKGHLLYGLNLARKSIRQQAQAVIVEGYMDVILLHQAGFTNTVSPMGTALTEDQLRQLKRFTRSIVLALDADAAGASATLRGLEVARQAMDRTVEIDAGAGGLFDARGLLSSETRLQADLRVTSLPPGMDPDEVVLRDPGEWKDILATAKPIVLHVMETLAAGRDLEDPKIKSEIAARVLPLVEDVPNQVEREGYRQRLARLLKVDERALVSSRPAPARPRRGRAATPENTPSPSPAQAAAALASGPANLSMMLEQHSLHLLLRQPDALYSLDRILQQAGLNRFSPDDFDLASHQSIARLLIMSLEQDELDPHQYLGREIPVFLQDIARQLLQPLPKGDPDGVDLVQDLARSIMRLRQVRISAGITQLHFLQEDLQQQGGGQLEGFQEMVLQYTKTLSRINQALGRPPWDA